VNRFQSFRFEIDSEIDFITKIAIFRLKLRFYYKHSYFQRNLKIKTGLKILRIMLIIKYATSVS